VNGLYLIAGLLAFGLVVYLLLVLLRAEDLG
jgi:K+-transporting ATPase KdpF subunit